MDQKKPLSLTYFFKFFEKHTLTKNRGGAGRRTAGAPLESVSTLFFHFFSYHFLEELVKFSFMSVQNGTT